MGSRKWLFVTLAVCGLASACSQYNTNLSIQTSSSTLTFVSPRSANAGSQGFTITANGSGFTSNAILLWNGAALTTTYVSAAELTATVPASNLTTAGTVQIAVQIPGSSTSSTSNVYNTTTTELSNIVLFEVSAKSGQPTVIGSISPPSAAFCSNPNGFTLTVNAAAGTTFTSDSLVSWNGSLRSTTVVSSTQLTASILPMDTASSTPAIVAVSSSSGTSTGVSFTMITPQSGLAAPQGVSMLTPAAALVGSQAVGLIVMGSSPGAGQAFLPCSAVQWVTSSGKTLLTTSYVSPTQLTATIPAADLTAAGSAQILVMTPAPGGGTSSTGQTFTITQPAAPTISSLSASTTSSASTPYCGTSSFTLTVNGSNFVNGSVINWNGSPLSSSNTTFVSSTQLTAIIPYTDTLTQGSVPFSVPVTVSNGSLVSNTVNFSVTAPTTNFPAPATTSLMPASAPAGSTLAVPLSVTGSSFLPCSVIQWGSTPLPTNYLSPTQLSTTITAAQIAAVVAGPVNVTVVNPSPGGGTSTPALTFTVAAPTITCFFACTTPPMDSAPSCSTSPLALTVNGTNFVPTEVVNWNGSPRPTTFVSSTQLQAAISAADTAFLATGPAAPAINVSNSSPSLITSSLRFSLKTPAMASAPSITALNPSSAATETAAAPALLLMVSGSNFYPCSSVNWSNTAAPSSPLPAVVFVGPTAINTLIPATNLTSVTSNQVTVSDPKSLGGATSNSATFQVFSPISSVLTSPAGIGGQLALPLMSSDQRYGVYVLASTDGTTEKAGTTKQIFLGDTCTGVTSGCMPSNTLVSVDVNNPANGANGDSISPSISADSVAADNADGRYVVFLSSAMNLVPSGTNGLTQVFVRDTCVRAPSGSNCVPTTRLVSVASDGVTQANAASTSATISANGRYVTFASSANNLAPNAPMLGGIYLRDTCAGVASGCTPSTQLLSTQSQ